MKSILFILRGPSGSGKSTWAHRFIAKYRAMYGGEPEGYDVGFNFYIFSADNYFLTPDNQYNFNWKLLPNAHQWCQSQCENKMKEGNNIIFIDNTNIRKADYQVYLNLAKQYKYEVRIRIMSNIFLENGYIYWRRNQHCEPLSTVKKQIINFEF